MQQPWNLLMRAKWGSKGPKVQAGGAWGCRLTGL